MIVYISIDWPEIIISAPSSLQGCTGETESIWCGRAVGVSQISWYVLEGVDKQNKTFDT